MWNEIHVMGKEDLTKGIAIGYLNTITRLLRSAKSLEMLSGQMAEI